MNQRLRRSPPDVVYTPIDVTSRGYIVSVTEGSLLELLQSASIPDGPLESMDEILLYVARKAQSADEYQTLENTDYPIAFAKHPEEFRYLLSNLAERNYIETPGTMGRSREFRLTPEGWERVAELRRSQRDSSQAFVAMWFNEELDPVWVDGFEPALEETGYRPIRIDRVEHSGKIDDRIVAEIRRSGLLVADFTGDRGGVYFEAGFAMGLGIPVIWTCRQGDLDKVHFDTRQFNHIVWTDAADLKKRLIDRIEATLPNRVRRTSE